MTFLNKNQYRKYPFTQEATLGTVPDAAIVGLRVNQCAGVIVRAALKHVRFVDGVFSAALHGIDRDNETWFIGNFAAKVTKDAQQVQIETNDECFASGYMLLGPLSAFDSNFYEPLGFGFGDIEPTCVGFYTRPAVTGVNVYPHATFANDVIKKTITGDLAFTLSGLSYTNTAGVLDFTADNVARITPTLSQSLCAGDCDTPIIYYINDVPADVDGNISLLVGPSLSIALDDTFNILQIESSVEKATLCATSAENTAPLLADNNYYAAIATTSKAEWATWPQYTL